MHAEGPHRSEHFRLTDKSGPPNLVGDQPALGVRDHQDVGVGSGLFAYDAGDAEVAMRALRTVY